MFMANFFSIKILTKFLNENVLEKDALFCVKITIVYIILNDSPYYRQLCEKISSQNPY